MTMGGNVLDVAGVSKRFGTLEVLSDISFRVAKGETVCVLGPSGSGKSTLLRCINWLEFIAPLPWPLSSSSPTWIATRSCSMYCERSLTRRMKSFLRP